MRLSWPDVHTEGYTGMADQTTSISVSFKAIVLDDAEDNSFYQFMAEATYGGVVTVANITFLTRLSPQVQHLISLYPFLYRTD
jgi:hypothetical protein